MVKLFEITVEAELGGSSEGDEVSKSTLFVCLSLTPSIHLPICPSIHLTISPSVQDLGPKDKVVGTANTVLEARICSKISVLESSAFCCSRLVIW